MVPGWHQSGQGGTQGLLRELNPGPLAPEARIMPLDQAAICLASGHTDCRLLKLSEADGDPDLGDSLALIPDLLSVLAAAGQANLLAMLSSTPTPWMDAVAKVGGLLQLHKHNC